MKPKNSDLVFNILNTLICIIVFISVIYPVYFVIIASVSNPISVANGNVWLYPKGFTLMGYKEIMNDSRIWTGYKNTLIYAIGGTLIKGRMYRWVTYIRSCTPEHSMME